MAIAAASVRASHGTGPRRRRDRRRAGAGGGLQRRPDQPGGLPELRAGREHGGHPGEGVLLGAQGRGAEGGGLPLPGVPGRTGLRRRPQHDQGPAAARRVQGQDASLQQVPHFHSWWISSTCAVFRGTILRGIAVVFLDTFSSITGRNRERLHGSSSVPISFCCIRLPRFGKRPPSRSNRCCDSAPVSWAHRRYSVYLSGRPFLISATPA